MSEWNVKVEKFFKNFHFQLDNNDLSVGKESIMYCLLSSFNGTF